jgi:multisubunit Na+/H+ antiporter MnhG subunit
VIIESIGLIAAVIGFIISILGVKGKFKRHEGIWFIIAAILTTVAAICVGCILYR